MRAKTCLVSILLVLPVLAAAAASPPATLRRFALVAGSNAGNDQTQQLRYAESDARSFAAVLQNLGGVDPKDLLLVLGPDVAHLNDAFRRMSLLVQSAAATDARRELVVYYSGHSDDDGLILGKDHLAWEDLRGEINAVDADVKVAIMDSCSSGSLTRAKGGVSRPAFLFDASSDMEGHAFLTSASAEEAAQESDRIGASFFTHYLVSGLRGAADADSDGVVTLNEAYAFAYQQTLASTEKTQYGPQHPAYDISLTGSGDLVLTDVRDASAGLTVADDMAGRLYVRDTNGNLVVELNKVQGQKVDLGLEPGIYTVLLDSKGARYQADLRVAASQRTLLAQSSMRSVPIDPAVARGPETPAPASAGVAAASGSPASGAPADATQELGNAITSLGNAIGKVVNQAVGAAVQAATNSINAASAQIGNTPTGGTPPPATQGLQPLPPLPALPPPAAGGTSAASGNAAPGTGGATTDTSPPPLSPSTDSQEPAPTTSAAPAPAATALDASGPLEAFHFSLLPEVYPGMFSATSRRVVNLNLLIGSSGSIAGMELGGLANIESSGVRGFQAAGLGNVVLGDVRGFQAAGLINYVRGDISLFQAAGLINMSRGLDGVQAAGMINMDLGDARGAELAGSINFSNMGFTGAQLAGLANVTRMSFAGAQVAGVTNVSLQDVRGAQVSGVFNYAGDSVRGAQISGVANRAGSVHGPQISLVNIAGDITGAQVGLVNIADTVSGTQVGLVNLSRQMHGIPVGLVSIVREGRHDVDTWVDLDGYTSANLTFGASSLYSVITAGWMPSSDPAQWSFGVGLGSRAHLGPLFLDYDLAAIHEMQGAFDWTTFGNFATGSVVPRLRVALGVPLFGALSLELGTTLRIDPVLLYNQVVANALSWAPFTPKLFFGVQL